MSDAPWYQAVGAAGFLCRILWDLWHDQMRLLRVWYVFVTFHCKRFPGAGLAIGKNGSVKTHDHLLDVKWYFSRLKYGLLIVLFAEDLIKLECLVLCRIFRGVHLALHRPVPIYHDLNSIILNG